MKSISLLVFVLLLCGCETNPRIFSEYRYAAYSWVGGDVDGMVAAWGEPTTASNFATSNEPGFKRWTATDKKKGTSAMESGGSFTKFSCDTIAWFDVSGTITEIDVQHWKACDEVYAGKLESMLRPGAPPPPAD